MGPFWNPSENHGSISEPMKLTNGSTLEPRNVFFRLFPPLPIIRGRRTIYRQGGQRPQVRFMAVPLALFRLDDEAIVHQFGKCPFYCRFADFEKVSGLVEG